MAVIAEPIRLTNQFLLQTLVVAFVPALIISGATGLKGSLPHTLYCRWCLGSHAGWRGAVSCKLSANEGVDGLEAQRRPYVAHSKIDRIEKSQNSASSMGNLKEVCFLNFKKTHHQMCEYRVRISGDAVRGSALVAAVSHS
jgi:hypothetical protein